jgi:hypothetical protein
LELPNSKQIAPEEDLKIFADALKAELLTHFDASMEERIRELIVYRIDVEATPARRERVREDYHKRTMAKKTFTSESFKPIRGHMKDCVMLDDYWAPPPECDPAYGEDPPPEIVEDKAAFDSLIDKLESLEPIRDDQGRTFKEVADAIDAAEKSLSDADASQLAADILQDQFEKHGYNARTEAAITAMRIAYGSKEEKVTDKDESVPIDRLRCDIDIRGIAKQAAVDAMDAAEMQKVWDAVYAVDPTLLANVVVEPVAADLPVDDEEKPKVFTAWYRVDRNTGKFTAITSMGCSACGRPLSEHCENKDGKFPCPAEKDDKTE